MAYVWIHSSLSVIKFDEYKCLSHLSPLEIYGTTSTTEYAPLAFSVVEMLDACTQMQRSVFPPVTFLCRASSSAVTAILLMYYPIIFGFTIRDYIFGGSRLGTAVTTLRLVTTFFRALACLLLL